MKKLVTGTFVVNCDEYHFYECPINKVKSALEEVSLYDYYFPNNRDCKCDRKKVYRNEPYMLIEREDGEKKKIDNLTEFFGYLGLKVTSSKKPNDSNLKLLTEDIPRGEDHLVVRVYGRPNTMTYEVRTFQNHEHKNYSVLEYFDSRVFEENREAQKFVSGMFEGLRLAAALAKEKLAGEKKEEPEPQGLDLSGLANIPGIEIYTMDQFMDKVTGRG